VSDAKEPDPVSASTRGLPEIVRRLQYAAWLQAFKEAVVDELLRVLREHATTDDPFSDWVLDVNSITTRVRAATSELLGDPEEAWQAAKNLRDTITGLGNELYGNCTIGVISVPGEGPELPITGWRGSVELSIATKP
jgi:hypothetical protein